MPGRRAGASEEAFGALEEQAREADAEERQQTHHENEAI